MGSTVNLEKNPDYMEGKFVAERMIQTIERTIYGDVATAIAKKKELLKDLEEQFNWGPADADYARTLGMIAALEAEQVLIDEREAANPTPKITLAEVDQVSKETSKSITMAQAELVIERYPGFMAEYPDQDKPSAIEWLINQILEDEH